MELQQKKKARAVSSGKQGARKQQPGFSFLMFALATAGLAVLGTGGAYPAGAQDTGAAQLPQLPMTSPVVQPAVSELRSALTALRITKWKAPGPVKEDADQNVGSVNRDLDTTLPGLLTQADASPRAVANVFAVYRNLDALYEVVLRISGTAELAASDSEVSALTHALATLEATRRSLADTITTASRAEETQLVQQRQVQEKAAAAPPPTPTSTVVNDGPAATPSHKKAKPKPKAPAPAAAPQG